MLGRPVMQITCDATALFVLGLKQAASRLAQRPFRLPPFLSINQQRNNQEKLGDDYRDAANNSPPVLLPRSWHPVFDDAAEGEIAFRKPPFLELPPVEHVNIGSRRFQHHLRQWFAVPDLNRCIGGY